MSVQDDVIPEQLKRAFKPGTEARAEFKKKTRRAGKVGRWVIHITTLVVLIVVLAFTWSPAEEKKLAEGVSAETARGQSPTGPQAPVVVERPRVREQDDLGVKQTLVVGDIWSEPVFLPNNRCFRWWGENPDNDDAVYRIEVREAGGGSEWRSWKEFRELRSKKRVGHPAWARFSAVGETATVHYTFYDLRSSRCQGKG